MFTLHNNIRGFFTITSFALMSIETNLPNPFALVHRAACNSNWWETPGNGNWGNITLWFIRSLCHMNEIINICSDMNLHLMMTEYGIRIFTRPAPDEMIPRCVHGITLVQRKWLGLPMCYSGTHIASAWEENLTGQWVVIMSLVQLMVCRLFGAKSLSEPMIRAGLLIMLFTIYSRG